MPALPLACPGRRPVHASRGPFQSDPYWRDVILFYAFFRSETGAGLGASHQPGWAALVVSRIGGWRRWPAGAQRWPWPPRSAPETIAARAGASR